MKTYLMVGAVAVVVSFGWSADGQTAGDAIANSARANVENTRRLYEEKARQDAIQAAILAARQAELNTIYSQDPWRSINGVTNCITGSGWFEFQGRSQEVLPEGVVFKGKWGPVLTIHTDPSFDAHQVTRVTSISQSRTTRNSTAAATHAVYDSGVERQLVYGNDFFFIKNFPYPAASNEGYEQKMAFLEGYFTYTNSSGQVLTIKSFDYGKPCTKIWAAEEISVAKQKLEQKKQLAEDRILKSNQDAADKGDAYGLLRMAERYRDGNGVPKDLAKARDYFSLAVAAGSPTAAAELEALSPGKN